MRPAKASAAFAADRAGVLGTHARPYDPDRPVVCVDGGGKQLVGDARPPRPARPGWPAEEGSEYERHGVANLFLAFEPLAGHRRVQVTERRTSGDVARFLRRLVGEQYPDAGRVVLVLDNLSTHTPAALYETFPPAEARRLVERLEWHYTPKHGSRRNVAEMELGVPARQCLDRRIPDLDALRREVAAWERDRNAAVVRVKLKKLYPSVELQ